MNKDLPTRLREQIKLEIQINEAFVLHLPEDAPKFKLLREAADEIERLHDANAKLRDAVQALSTELTTEAQSMMRQPEAGRILRDAQPDLGRHVVGMIQGSIEHIEAMLAAEPVRTTVTVGAVNIPGRREPGISLQAGADGRLAPVPAVTDAMVSRAVDGWEQWWNGYTGVPAIETTRAAMRHALEQALGVRS